MNECPLRFDTPPALFAESLHEHGCSFLLFSLSFFLCVLCASVVRSAVSELVAFPLDLGQCVRGGFADFVRLVFERCGERGDSVLGVGADVAERFGGA